MCAVIRGFPNRALAEPELIAGMSLAQVDRSSLHDGKRALEYVSHLSGFRPQLMRKATVLYRSVSLPELRDICVTGAVTGGRNLFNLYDPREDVFFGDALSPELIRQGEYIDRQVKFALHHHAAGRRFRLTEATVDGHVSRIFAAMKATGVLIDVDPDLVFDFRWDIDRRTVRRIIKRRGKKHMHHFRDLFRTLAGLEVEHAASEKGPDGSRVGACR